jgi:diaminopimelate epimerase
VSPQVTNPFAIIPFTKASACGNDFLIVDAQHATSDIHQLTRRLCDRHNGVGADGVEWLQTGDDEDAGIKLINADGSEAEISGNGTRCVAAYLAESLGGTHFKIRTDAGVKSCDLISKQEQTFTFEMEMGSPKVDKAFAVQTRHGSVSGIPVSMGNPHFVVFVDSFPDEWQAMAAEIQKQPCFREGVNVEFVQTLAADLIDVRFFERGAGETQSSGTGSCASAVASIFSGKVKSPVSVHAVGGTQSVRWENDQVFLRGPARLVCRGEFFV